MLAELIDLAREYDYNALLILCDKQNQFCTLYEGCNTESLIQRLIDQSFRRTEALTNSDVTFLPHSSTSGLRSIRTRRLH